MAVSKTSLQVSLEAPLVPSRKQYVYKTAAVGYTDFPRSDLLFTWNVIVKPLKSGSAVESPPFKVPIPGDRSRSSIWHLQLQSPSSGKIRGSLYFEGEEAGNASRVHRVQVAAQKLVDHAQSKFCIVDCTFSILNPRTNTVQFNKKASPILCSTIGERANCSLFHENRLGDLTVDGILTMKVTACLVYFQNPIKAIEAAASPVLPSNVLDGLKKLHKDKNFTDVLIKCGEEEFEAHKAILASQSPVFEKMFENNMKDNAIVVTDIDSDVMSDLLDFLYTGRVPNLHILAKSMLYAAFKYKLPQLVVLCENELMLNLYVDNLLEMVQCADTCGAVNLKRACLRMIKSNSEDLFKSETWKNFKTTAEENLVYEVLEL